MKSFFAVVHLAGAVLVVCAVVLALVRFFRFQDLVIPVLTAGIVLNLAAYLTSSRSHGILDTREIAGVLALGAALAGRMFGERVLSAVLAAIRTRSWALFALAVVAGGYLGALAYDTAQPSAPPANQPLASWLVAHGLTDGLAGYWEASSTTVDSGGRVLVSGVTSAAVVTWCRTSGRADDSEYNPSLHDANFMVTGGPLPLSGASDLRRYGPSAVRSGSTGTTATPSWSGTPTSWPTSADPPPVLCLTCRGRAAWPPRAALAARRRRSGSGRARKNTVSGWPAAGSAPAGRAR